MSIPNRTLLLVSHLVPYPPARGVEPVDRIVKRHHPEFGALFHRIADRGDLALLDQLGDEFLSTHVTHNETNEA